MLFVGQSMYKKSLITISEYDAIAEEYYNSECHPTCANFRYLSIEFIKNHFENNDCKFRRCLEVGAGRSVLAELKKLGNNCFDHITIMDKNKKMLKNSNQLENYYNNKLITDIENTKSIKNLNLEKFDLIVAILADPYNSSGMWESIKSIIAENGLVLFTTPSYEWAQMFRKDQQSELYEVAEFRTQEGKTLYVRSVVLNEENQVILCNQSGFKVSSISRLTVNSIVDQTLSPKLRSAQDQDIPVVTGYVIEN